jgi:heparan-alpha-glucosaminide N-acetyltransferase
MSNTALPSPASAEHSAPSTLAAAQEAPKPERLLSPDAYRGAIMLLMASSGLGLGAVAAFHRNNAMLQFLAEQSDHATWVGCHLWDLIQPAFMFMVGVALPWSVTKRRACGQPFGAMFGHALGRSLLLVLLGVFLSSVGSRQTVWSFNNVLAQIGLG